ncbi:MAG: S-layer homology domain-containing protein [Candidatus Ornithomonoglobus sp.]
MKKIISMMCAFAFLIGGITPMNSVSAESDYDICNAEKAFENKIKSEKKNQSFRDAYMVDVLNNNQPVLAIVNNEMRGYTSSDYIYENGSLKSVTDEFVFNDDLDMGYGLLSYSGGTGGMGEHYLAYDSNMNIYYVRDFTFRNGMHGSDYAKSNMESDVVSTFEIGIYNGSPDAYRRIYRNERYYYNGQDSSYTISSYGYDEGGNAYELDLGDGSSGSADGILSHFGLTRLIENDANDGFPELKGSKYDKFYCTPADWADFAYYCMKNLELLPDDLQHMCRRNITRGEFCRLICNILSKHDHPEISRNISEADAVKKCSELDIISGYSDTDLGEKDLLTREQTAAFLKRTLKALYKDTSHYTDKVYADEDEFSEWSEACIKYVSDCVIDNDGTAVMSGVEDNRFDPKGNLTREQAVVIAYRLHMYTLCGIEAYVKETRKNPFNEFDDDTAFLKERNNFIDGFAIGYNNWWTAIEMLCNDKTHAELAVKESLIDLLDGVSEYKSMDAGVDVLAFGTGAAGAIDFLSNEAIAEAAKKALATTDDVNALNEIEAMSKQLNKMCDIADIGMLTAEEIEGLMRDYSKHISYIIALKNAFKDNNTEDDMIYTILCEMEDEYSDKWLMTLKNTISDGGELAIKKLITGVTPLLSFVDFAHEWINKITTLNKRAVSLSDFYASYCYASYIKSAYGLYTAKILSGDYSQYDINQCETMFILSKHILKKEYEDMIKITTKKDDKSYLQKRLDEINKLSYTLQ